MGWPVYRRRIEGLRPQADDGGRRASRGRRSVDFAQVARADAATRRSRSSAASPRTTISSNGPTRCGSSAPASGSEVALADFRKDVTLEFYNEAGQLALAYKIYRCWPSPNTRPCPISTPTPTPSRSSTSCSRTKAGSATRASRSPRSRGDAIPFSRTGEGGALTFPARPARSRSRSRRKRAGRCR